MKQRFTINLAVLMEEMVNILLHSDEVDADDNGVWGTLNGEFIQLSWADLMDIRDSPDINSSTESDIQQLMEERGEGMKIGEKASFWSYNGDEGDVHFGTLLAIHGDRATIQERGRKTSINVKWIFETWKQK